MTTTERAPLQFACWVPNVSGGRVVSNVEQRTDWSYDYNVELARTAERNGFDYALTQVRYLASYGAANQHESTSFSLALLAATERLKVIAAVHPGMWQRGVLAKFLTTADHISGGRAAVNVVSGWLKNEFTQHGEPWLEHGERYRRAEELIQYLREVWTADSAEFSGDFYRLHDFAMRPKPLDLPGRPHPEIFMGGNSTAARGMGGRVADWYFMNGNSYDGAQEQVEEVSAHAAAAGRTVKFGLNGFMIARDTEAEAHGVLEEIITHADREAVESFGEAVKQAGASTADRKGMWADAKFDDMVQYNEGFRTGLVGTPEQVATRLLEYRRRGVDLMLLGFLHFQEEVEYFGREVLPVYRELEARDLAVPAVAS
ncbi:dimethylsulfone monooxygenase SfnG [Nocardioides daphniae]|uniref:Dimethyl sulfone monooxygenase SfnG n=1 Tax=Nocardioides daphniae TaxID=402297 RepID=A0A4P7U966_9ACTN|nr:dimethyl sulfone monooxygenase SfnG [Nocardioides daphniae]QCC76536.1 dimethyl sulfone monooxygenase SfnG [Nocardioides daphniae]GGD05605.1 dimethyl sulfone monooxygenase SfnG [Nocardioides daphniae]